MTPSQLYDFFRSDIVDSVLPYLWTDDEVWEYMDDAYSMFVRLTGGIPDATSDVTKVAVTAGAAFSPVSELILKIRRATLASTGLPLAIKNVEDTPLGSTGDYGAQPQVAADSQPGIIRTMVIGEQDGLCRWIQLPATDDVVNLVVYRLPLNIISEASGDNDLNEVHYRHHRNFLLWMKHRAYGKQDAETFNKAKSEEFKDSFESYCVLAKAEKDRQKSKVRIVRYGGL